MGDREAPRNRRLAALPRRKGDTAARIKELTAERAQAWDEGYQARRDDSRASGLFGQTPTVTDNPYRTAPTTPRTT